MMAVKAVKAVKAVTSIFSPEYFKLYTQILFLTIFLYMLYYFVRLVVHIAYANKCTNCQYIIKEGYANDSVTYFQALDKRCDDINAKVDGLNSQLSGAFDDMPKDICYVTQQIDESLSGNYAGAVGPEERKYSAEDQKARAAKRKEAGQRYVTNLKKAFVESHEGTPLLECFATEAEDLASQRSALDAKISETASNLDALDNSMIVIQKDLGKAKLQTYYTTLNYNDKYLRKLDSSTGSAVNAIEGFSTVPNSNSDGTLNFKPVSKSDDKGASLEERVTALDSHFGKSKDQFTNLIKTLNLYKNTIKKQTEKVKKYKGMAQELK